MNFILQNLITYLVIYKYVTIFIIALIAAFVVPIPSGSILMAASAFASIGYFNIYWVTVISIIGNILGDNALYFLAKGYGRRAFSRIGFRNILESNNFKNIEENFKKRPGLIIFISRFEVLFTLSVNLLSGVSKIHYKKYFTYEFLGSVAQVCIYSFIGYFFSDSWESINSTIGRVTLILILILVLFIISFGKKRIVKKFG